MSLVAKYNRRDDSDEEESVTNHQQTDEKITKKRIEPTETDNRIDSSTEPKRAKTREADSSGLELPSFFDSEDTKPKKMDVDKQSTPSESKTTRLVPRQVRGGKPNIVTDDDLATKLSKSPKSSKASQRD